jgi:predicted Zn-dependent protease
MVKNILTVLVVFFLAGSLAGCSTIYNPATGRNELILINSSTEVAIGQKVIPELLREHPLSGDARMQNRLRAIGNRIAATSDRKDIGYKFAVLKDKELNAMTIPGGFVYVNEGLMKVLNDQELAYVVAHEVGHTAARHIVKKIQAGMTYQLILTVAFAGLGGNSGDATEVMRGVNTVYNLIQLSYSRKDEYEADRLGAKYALGSGFDPYASISALEKIKKEEGPNWKMLGYFRTHPYVDERIAALKKFIPQLKK